MKNRYVGEWSANNNSTYNDDYFFANKKEAIKTMRDISEGNMIENCRWSVASMSDGNIVASGGRRKHGGRYREI